jgi:hypothetical protein
MGKRSVIIDDAKTLYFEYGRNFLLRSICFIKKKTENLQKSISKVKK